MTAKSPFYNFHHVGVVVRDLDKAIAYYEKLGIGPFKGLSLPGTLVESKAFGKPISMNLRTASAHIMGSVELELIQPIEGPVQEEFLEEHGEGINHIGFKVADIGNEMTGLVNQGFKIIQDASLTSGIRSVYFDTRKVGGFLIELWQPPTR